MIAMHYTIHPWGKPLAYLELSQRCGTVIAMHYTIQPLGNHLAYLVYVCIFIDRQRLTKGMHIHFVEVLNYVAYDYNKRYSKCIRRVGIL